MTAKRKPVLSAKVIRGLLLGMGYVVRTGLESNGDEFELTKGNRKDEDDLLSALSWVERMAQYRRSSKQGES